MVPNKTFCISILLGALGAGLATSLGSMLFSTAHGQGTYAITLTAEQREILSHMSIVYLDDGQGGQVETIRITGVNVQLVNGLGATESVNGTGNLIVGYQEMGNDREPDNRTGSHYIVVGSEHNYTAFGGIVAGQSNASHGNYACVNGGRQSIADGPWSSIAGGGFNQASGQQAVVVGGNYNYSAADSTVVVGGSGNQAVAPGGGGAGAKAVVVGGFSNKSRGQGSVVVGGEHNDTTANYSAILAGSYNTCIGDPQGGGSFCAIVGGERNQTSQTMAATVCGGLSRSANGPDDWVAGSLFQDQ